MPVLTVMVLTASCGYAAALHAAEIPQEELVGTWTSSAGTSWSSWPRVAFSSGTARPLPSGLT
ncbi:hypothetical protein [Streptomyces zhihengii]